jgi:hypothetical protein
MSWPLISDDARDEAADTPPAATNRAAAEIATATHELLTLLGDKGLSS